MYRPPGDGFVVPCLLRVVIVISDAERRNRPNNNDNLSDSDEKICATRCTNAGEMLAQCL